MSPARRTFGATWWGRAWTDALEHRARLDPNRLPRGRTYARANRASALRLAAGEITATVAGSRARPYSVRIRIRTFDDDEWERVLAAVASKAGHAAALLDGELDPGIVEDARAVGVELLPDAGELQPRCSCPDWADPCKHSAAVCYLVADELDADPFALFELRGRGRDQVLAELRRRRSGGVSDAGGGRQPALTTTVDAGIPAREAWSRPLGELPEPPTPRPAPGRPAPWPVDPPADTPFTAAGLRSLATDAAERAWRLTRGEAGSGLDLDEPADLARRASSALGAPEWDGLAVRSGVAGRELAGRAIAWRHAGVDGLRMLDESRWRPPTATMAAARDAIASGGGAARDGVSGGGSGRAAPTGPSGGGGALEGGSGGSTSRRLRSGRSGAEGPVRVDSNRLTLPGGVQLRLGRDGRWYRFEKPAGRWQLAAPPADDPDDLLDLG